MVTKLKPCILHKMLDYQLDALPVLMHNAQKRVDNGKKKNIIVGQSGGPTEVINSSLAEVYKNAIERGFDKVYGMLHGIQGLWMNSILILIRRKM